jgi:hypothetical protein
MYLNDNTLAFLLVFNDAKIIGLLSQINSILQGSNYGFDFFCFQGLYFKKSNPQNHHKLSLIVCQIPPNQ